MGGEESKLKEKKKADKCEVIASIDFGTRYTGYAFMFRSNAEVYKPQRTDMKRDHTCIMLKKKSNGAFEFSSFGTKAMDKFIEMEKEGNDYFFFRLFKTAMVEKDTEKSLFVKDHKGREVDAKVVFSNVYEFVRSKTLDFLKQTVAEGKRIQDDDILWMITIPVTWGLLHRDFIRKAADKSYHNIEIVLEPEAASMYIRNKPMAWSFKGHKIEPFKNGQCYILVDIGAGTTDICTHKVQSDGNLIEMCSSSGINEGGEQVNIAFFKELNTLFTKEVMDSFKKDEPELYKLEQEFEDIKHKFKADTDGALVLFLPENLLNISDKKTGRKFEIPATYSEKLELKKRNRMHMKPKFMASLFDPIISTISSKICEQICESEKVGHTLSCIILSGGLSESDYVYDSISKTLADSSGDKIPVILSPNARNAVVEGALQMGLNPKGIVGRRSPFTYGFYSIIPFEEGKHPQHLKVIREGIPLCTAVFYKLFGKGDIVKKGDSFIRKSVTSYKTDKNVTRYMSLWRSFKSTPKYCTLEEECEEAAKIEIPSPRGGWPDRLNHIQRLVVLGNEFKIEFINENTKEKYDCEVHYTF